MTVSTGLRALVRLWVLVGIILSFGETATAQTANATLQGTITDSSGAVLPGVTVKLQSSATGLSRDLVTNVAGQVKVK